MILHFNDEIFKTQNSDYHKSVRAKIYIVSLIVSSGGSYNSWMTIS
ncbi:hypothetical protein M595_2076 [Lyngbya aestuarii BL J]|uniref:Uncharacterized protein n=1 Tax=Lyngbya aestuarii BL J TaxID=1348334 RepID=U7QIY7_9CYAN|nr:hypothetical protein M595_2076 [Lyngbya aestuarii BL J]